MSRVLGLPRLHLTVLALVIVAQLIGIREIAIGDGSILFLPLLYAFVLAALLNPVINGRRVRLLSDADLQGATSLLVIGILPFLAKLGTLIGPELRSIIDAGPALIASEFGHLATIAVAFPLALALGMGREAIGATFSIDREPNIAVITDRYGLATPEGAGVMGVYVCGTLFGTVVLSVLAPLVASLGIFSNDAMAIGCGVGSGSLTAACGAALTAQIGGDPDALLALAAASNLLTTALGVAFALYISLPLVERLYRLLARRQSADTSADASQRTKVATGTSPPSPADLRPITVAALAVLVVAIALIGNWIDPGDGPGRTVIGGLLLVAMVLAGYGATQLVPRVPPIVWISFIAVLVTIPGTFVTDWISDRVATVDFLALTTPVLAYAGFAISAREITVFKRSGWRIVLIAVVVFTASFIGATAAADLFT